MMAWSDRRALVRLRDVLSGIPGYNYGGGSASATVASLAGYARDASIGLRLARDVHAALLAPRPHPEWGDDGHRDSLRETAAEALDWAERWLALRVADNFGTSTGRYDYMSQLPA